MTLFLWQNRKIESCLLLFLCNSRVSSVVSCLVNSLKEELYLTSDFHYTVETVYRYTLVPEETHPVSDTSGLAYKVQTLYQP